VHGKNLCATYQQLMKGEKKRVAWRLHFIWYLESLMQGTHILEEQIAAMQNASNGILTFHGREVDLSQEHVTCANVLEEDVTRMEEFLFGECREKVIAFVRSFRKFLHSYGIATLSNEASEARA